MAKRRARTEVAVHQSWCFDEECRRIRMSRIESKPFSDALEALSSGNQELFLSETGNRMKNSGAERVGTHLCVGEIAKKLKQTFVGPTKKSRSINCIHGGVVDATNPSTKNVRTKEKQQPLELERGRKKIDISEKDAILTANRAVCNRLIMSSLEHDCWDSQRLSPLRMSTEMFTRTESSLILSTREEAQDEMRRKSVETNEVLHYKSPDDEHSVLVDSDWENDFPSTPPSINGFNVCESIKYQEEHESPVSVLDQDNIHKPPSSSSSSSIIIFQTGMKSLKPRRRLCFEECSDEQDCNISQYVHLVLKASSLNWDHISTIMPPPSDELLHSDPHFHSTRLLFDRINDVLLQIHRSHLLSATQKRRMNHRLPLEQVVADEILREAEFYQTQERTLDQIVAKDVADCRLWFDLMLETQHDIIIHVSQHILEESIVDVMLDIHC